MENIDISNIFEHMKETNPYKIILVLLGIIVFVVGFYFHKAENFLVYRFLRGFVSFLFLAVLLWYKRKNVNKLLVLFLILYGLSSILTIGYENSNFATIALVCNVLSFVVLAAALLPKVNFKKIKGTFLVLFIVVGGVIAYLLFELIRLFINFSLGSLHAIFICLSAIVFLMVTYFSFLYNHRYSTRASLVFLLFNIILVFAEVFRAIAYYQIAYGSLSVHISRLLLITAMALLVHYCFLPKTKDEQLNDLSPRLK